MGSLNRLTFDIVKNTKNEQNRGMDPLRISSEAGIRAAYHEGEEAVIKLSNETLGKPSVTIIVRQLRPII